MPTFTAAWMTSRSAGLRPCQKASFTTTTPGRDDVRGEDDELLHLVELAGADGRQRILLAVDHALLEGEIELAEVDRRRLGAPGLDHGAEDVVLRHAHFHPGPCRRPI